MDLLILTSLAALGAGAAAAGLAGPVSCTWPSTGADMLRRLKAVRFYRRLGRARTLAGSALVAALLAGGGLAAYAAAPATTTLDTLPSQVAGVVGSGDKLSLRLTGSDGARTVAVGEVVTEGWVLSGLTPDRATLSKDGQTREVGLNPTGALASAATDRPSSVRVEGLSSLTQLGNLQQTMSMLMQTATANDLIARASQTNNSAIANKVTLSGLSTDESLRFWTMSNKIEQRKVEIQQGLAPPVPFFSDDLLHPGDELISSVLGPDAADYNRYLNAIDDNASIGSQRAQLANNPITGPSTYYLPAGANARAVIAEAGIDARGTWIATLPDANGGQTYTRVSDLGGAQQLRNAAQAQATLRDTAAIAGGADPAQFGMTPAGAAAARATVPPTVRTAAGL